MVYRTRTRWWSGWVRRAGRTGTRPFLPPHIAARAGPLAAGIVKDNKPPVNVPLIGWHTLSPKLRTIKSSSPSARTRSNTDSGSSPSATIPISRSTDARARVPKSSSIAIQRDESALLDATRDAIVPDRRVKQYCPNCRAESYEYCAKKHIGTSREACYWTFITFSRAARSP